MASYNQSSGNDPNSHLNGLLARLQAGRNGGNTSDDGTRDLLSRFSSFNSGAQSQQSYYGGHQSEGQDSPLVTGSDGFPPPAPTPPMSHFSHSHHPPGMPPGMMGGMNLGPIGTMPPSAMNKSDQSASLLNLLKYNGNGNGNGNSGNNSTHSHTNSQSSPTTQQHAPSLDDTMILPHANIPTLHAPVPMPADPQGFLASLMKGDPNHENSRTEVQVPKWNATAPPEETQAYLLNLLQRKKPSQIDQPSTVEAPQPPSLTPQSANEPTTDDPQDFHLKQEWTEKSSHDATPLAFQQHNESPLGKFEYASPSSQTGAPAQPSRNGRFDYNNPFEDLAASSPHTKAPKSSTPGTAVPGIQILKKAPSNASSPSSIDRKRQSLNAHRSPLVSPDINRRKIESPSRFEPEYAQDTLEENETVAEAINDLAETANREAQEALARAEDQQVQARIARDLDDMMNATTDAAFQEKSETAARHIKEELDKAENAGLLEDALSPEIAQAVRDIVDETAGGHGALADSWESAEADEIIVIEEAPAPVKVYNFPMKPWISISLQDTDETRPLLRDEVILDIARIKKDFDQIDRNLVAASEIYIVYGMSKAGGFRVIRQDDGRDAKLFTDTKDRIFNLAISSTPSDLNTTQKESIIGTGISGTVYYVLIKNGDKDYLDDAHPEQYGFALPPISTQEGDAPGGVLKTRARTSSTHPDYFAVGRGKTISIIWPSYIMKHNLFKPGHDRVVDTEKLSAKCSLRINTGKAGKDFTFSQDDTMIVSLDKSGRVKFWDVTDLTAVDEGSDSRFPMPAQTSLEIKEPLMTLTTTPEGEKAWPTSVLLLDKQRPYQKRCALRYMIVGMKQNHTLQLWDLALGKPVQEFNLPHSKESDAVCSVMYHPATGMVVVGHPTRNSLYFLHLSAPKYTIKGLSQVDYIQKLVAKDSSIPEPDSTAVISGVREYSFFNKGVIRSLDMLSNPTSTPDDDGEQTLFELYAMHSKGVAGIYVKQAELGWNKDNKVVVPVDAVEAGIVKITKLKELPNPQQSEPQILEDTTLPTRGATRSNKDANNQSVTAEEGANRKGTDELATPIPVSERKAEAPVTPINQLDKSERKARKKREKAAAAIAAAAAAEKQSGDNTQSYASSHSPRIIPTSKSMEPKPASALTQSTMAPEALEAAFKQLERNLGGVIEKTLQEQRSMIDAEFRSRDAAFREGQMMLLDSVSSTLDGNVQKLLTKTISNTVENNVIPQLGDVLTRTVSEQLGRVVSDQIDSKISGRISHAIQNQMQKLLPAAVAQALQKPELSQAITDKIVKNLASNVETRFLDALHNTVTPAFTQLAVAAAGNIANDVQRQATEQIDDLEQKLRADSNKIDQLTALVTRLSDTVTSMAATQARFQDSFLKLQQYTPRDRQPSETISQAQYSQTSQGQSYGGRSQQNQSYDSPSTHSNNQLVAYPSSVGSSRDLEFDRKVAEIQAQVEGGQLEGALVKWLQSDRKDEIFKAYLVKLNPQLLSELSPLVSLAAIAEIARELDGNLLREKIGWMEVIVHSIHNSLPRIEPQVREVIPNILSGFISQIEHLFMRVSNVSPSEPILKHLSGMVAMANRVVEVARKPNLGGY
ncbi:uncharacterized protein BCR38DRAFT_409575 [Pseudomassariella vexata]|uniref:EDC4-like protein pdc1 beta-propeller domain-containing protein n=1 Tax=Pseudomassariella vexata TaxID=1141098 RepID=A0A1Y2DZY4_9PEZI|nr:uncharacterized protein BCR38DRAFT_409575 [Pseudomassariella vexata]ORY64185.1 hypothetical protein BCR38DRAFT_409575 [Pseudomassariella vexata]